MSLTKRYYDIPVQPQEGDEDEFLILSSLAQDYGRAVERCGIEKVQTELAGALPVKPIAVQSNQ